MEREGLDDAKEKKEAFIQERVNLLLIEYNTVLDWQVALCRNVASREYDRLKG